jgi:hypothetical protein
MSGRFRQDSAYGKAFAKAYDEVDAIHPSMPEEEKRPLVVKRTEEILEARGVKHK